MLFLFLHHLDNIHLDYRHCTLHIEFIQIKFVSYILWLFIFSTFDSRVLQIHFFVIVQSILYDILVIFAVFLIFCHPYTKFDVIHLCASWDARVIGVRLILFLFVCAYMCICVCIYVSNVMVIFLFHHHQQITMIK